MLSSSSAHRVALTQHETNWTSKAASHNLGLLVLKAGNPDLGLLGLCGHPSTKWSECLLWELEVKETGEPRPLEVYPVAPRPRHSGHLSGLLKLAYCMISILTPSSVFPINPRSYSSQEA